MRRSHNTAPLAFQVPNDDGEPFSLGELFESRDESAKERVERILETLYEFLFPIFYGPKNDDLDPDERLDIGYLLSDIEDLRDFLQSDPPKEPSMIAIKAMEVAHGYLRLFSRANDRQIDSDNRRTRTLKSLAKDHAHPPEVKKAALDRASAH